VALQAEWPLPDREARFEVAEAIYYASVEHAAWFWAANDAGGCAVAFL
jgi:hypothetical protein